MTYVYAANTRKRATRPGSVTAPAGASTKMAAYAAFVLSFGVVSAIVLGLIP